MFASPAYVTRHGKPSPTSDLRGHEIVAYGAPLEHVPGACWLDEHAEGARIVLTGQHLACHRGRCRGRCRPNRLAAFPRSSYPRPVPSCSRGARHAIAVGRDTPGPRARCSHARRSRLSRGRRAARPRCGFVRLGRRQDSHGGAASPLASSPRQPLLSFPVNPVNPIIASLPCTGRCGDHGPNTFGIRNTALVEAMIVAFDCVEQFSRNPDVIEGSCGHLDTARRRRPRPGKNALELPSAACARCSRRQAAWSARSIEPALR